MAIGLINVRADALLSMAKRAAAVSFLRDFKDFIQRGNVVDLAVAVILGGAFGKVVDAVVSLVIGGLVGPAMKAAGASSLASWPAGTLLVAIINFLVIALVVFLIVRAIEAMKRQARRDATEEAVLDPQEQLAAAANRLAEALERRQL